MKKKFSMLVSLLMVSIMTLTACGGGQTAETKTQVATPQVNRIVTNNSSEPATLDPAKAQGTHESFPMQHLFEGLTRITEEGKIENALADSIEVSEDGLTYTIKLKEGLKWSDGKPITAHDYEFSWKRVVDPATAADYAYILYYIKGAEAYNNGEGSRDDVAVKALDDLTIQVELAQPTAYFDSLLAFYTYYPVQKELVEANPNWANDPATFVSNGAFKLTSWEHNAKITMDKNEYFYNADAVTIDGIDLDILEDQTTSYNKYISGDYNTLITVLPSAVGQLQDEKSLELKLMGDLGIYYYNLNSEVPPLNNVKIRKALGYAIDREVLTNNITKGGEIPASTVVPPGMLDDKGVDFTEANKGTVKTDVQEAKKLLEEGLAEEGMTVEDLNLSILYNTDDKHKLIAQAVQQMWKQNLGVDVTLNNVEFKVKLDMEKAGDYTVSRAGWVGDYQDPMTFMDLWMTGGSFNDANYANPEYDSLVKEAMISTDQKLRMDNMKKAEKMLLEDMAVIPIYYYTHPVLVKPNVTGIYKTLTNYPTLTYAKITLNE